MTCLPIRHSGSFTRCLAALCALLTAGAVSACLPGPSTPPSGYPTTVSFTAVDDTAGDSFLNVTFPAGTCLAGTYNGWCLDGNEWPEDSTLVTAPFSGTVVCSTSAAAAAVYNPVALAEVNWLLNQGAANLTTLTGDAVGVLDIQNAVWGLVANPQGVNPNLFEDTGPNSAYSIAVDLFNAAVANGSTFVPGCNDLVGILLLSVTNPNPNPTEPGPFQPLIVLVPKECCHRCGWECPNPTCPPKKYHQWGCDDRGRPCGDRTIINCWNTKSGCNRILCFDGGSRSCNLANWLACNYKYTYGRCAGWNNLTGRCNADVLALFKNACAESDPTDAHILCTALNLYATCH
jgi:hypothetical protein